MQWLSDFLYQWITIFLFAIAIGFMFYFLSERDQAKMLWCGFLAWTFMGAALALYLNAKVLIEPQFSGILRPANEPSPPLPSFPPQFNIPENALWLFFGGMTAFTAYDFCRVLNVSGEDLISMRRDASGILVTAKVFSVDGRIVAEIQDNEFHLNPNNFFRRERPNKSELIVFDQQNAKVLDVKFLNSHAIKILGRFPTKRGLLIATDGSTRLGKSDFSGNFAGNGAPGGSVFRF